MKYKHSTEIIPQDKREKLNNTILALIDTSSAETKGITNQDIFSAYTGTGGLSGLKRSDYDNYYEYSEAKKEIENGQFFTPDALAKSLMDCIKPTVHNIIADLTCGSGAFVNHAPSEHNFYGCELDGNAYKVAKYLYPAAQFVRDDIRNYDPGVVVDIVVGNPPFNLKWRADGTEYKSQLFYCMKAHEVLCPGGLLALITPMSFLSDDFSSSGDIEMMNKLFSFLCACPLPRDAFRMMGVTDYATKMIFFQKRSAYIEHSPYDHRRFDAIEPDVIFHKYIEPAKKAADAVRHRLRAEQKAQRAGREQFFFQVDKLLFDIGRHPATREKLGKCRAYLDKFLTQKQPSDMKYDEWQRKKLTEAKVIAYLRQALRGQNPKRKNPPRNNFDRPERRRQYEVEWQSVPFDELPPDKNIDEFLRCIVYTSRKTGEEKRLNEKQLLDTNRILQKRYGFLQWEQGSGKTLHGIANAIYRIMFNKVRQVFIVSTAISIKNNWADVLPEFRVPFAYIHRLKDINRLRERCIAIITIDMACKYRKQLHKYVKMKGQNVALIFDESDAITSVDSKCTKAMLEIFRRAHFKTLMTGTSTRNNICEFYPQLELMYNNSENMMCESAGYPFPPYKKGYTLFSETHLPDKITVFGVAQKTQDIYNADDLKVLLDKTIITRTLEEITGRKMYDPIQHNIEFNQAERDLYRMAVKEFGRLRYKYFNSTGNSRKDAMMRLIQQIKMLLRICAAPDSISEYGGGITSKQTAIINLLNSWENERVAIGVRYNVTLNSFSSAIKAAMPNRPLFLATGSTKTFKQRKTLINDVGRTSNGILLCTQQAFPNSINADCIDKAIIPELHWNNAGMSQWYFRFIRHDSTRFKEVHFVTVENSLESNLMCMVINKEKLNLFMKNQETAEDEVMRRFGVNYDLLSMLMICEIDDDGNFQIRWGEQTIV